MNHPKRRKPTLQAQITAILAAILVCNALFTGAAYYRYAYQNIMENYQQTTNALLDKIMLYLDEHLVSLTSRVDALNSNLSFVDALNQLAVEPGDAYYARQQSVIADFIAQLELSDSLIDSCYIYTEYGAFDSFTHLRNEQFRFKESAFYTYFGAFPSVQAAHFSQTQDYMFKTEYPVIPVVFRREAAGSTVYYCIALDTRMLAHYLRENYALFDGIRIARNGEPVVEVNNRMTLSWQEAAGDVTDYIRTQAMIPRISWEITLFKSRQELTESLISIRLLIGVQLVMAAAIALAVGRFFTRAITRPIRSLSETMRRAPQEKFSLRFYALRQDEIGCLAASFNYMSDEINRLVDALTEKIREVEEEKENLRREQEAKRIAELRMLQAQINLHFLYNTLNLIAWQAAGQGAMQACQTANLLGKFFRSSLGRGQKYGTLREEEQQISSYLEIQQIRYKNRLDFRLDIAPEILDNETVHLVLQPLVENALYHGVNQNARSEGKIEVRGQREGNMVCLTVEDNGPGIPPEKLDQLNRALLSGKADPSQGYGIFNVNERVRLSYGPEYGLLLQSEYGQWTRAVLTLPVRPLRGEYLINERKGEGS